MVQVEDRMNTPDHIEGGSSFVTVDKLMRLMKIGDARSRERSARALGELLDRKCVPVLIEALKDEDMAVRKSALHALSKIKDPSSIGAITCALCNR
jgi:HEAT repeat protein